MHTHTIICLLHFLITVTIGGPPVRIYLLPLLPPIHLPRSLTPLLPGSQATIGPDSPLTLLQRQDKRNFSRKKNIWPPPHTKQTLYIMVSICVCVFLWVWGKRRLLRGNEVKRKRKSRSGRRGESATSTEITDRLSESTNFLWRSL